MRLSVTGSGRQFQLFNNPSVIAALACQGRQLWRGHVKAAEPFKWMEKALSPFCFPWGSG